jgi:hypothetical protein
LGSYLLPGICFVALLGALYIPIIDCLVVESKQGNTVYCKPWEQGERFEISYIHSVNKSVITDVFSTDEGKNILLLSSRFKSFGAGVATAPENIGGRIVLKEDYLEYEEIYIGQSLIWGFLYREKRILPCTSGRKQFLLRLLHRPAPSFRYE